MEFIKPSMPDYPIFLAASADGDRYLELARQDISDCTKSHAKVCRLRTHIAKSDEKKFCVLALSNKISRHKTRFVNPKTENGRVLGWYTWIKVGGLLRVLQNKIC